MGRANVVMVDSHGVKYGASDPHADAEAIPEHPVLEREWQEGNAVEGRDRLSRKLGLDANRQRSRRKP